MEKLYRKKDNGRYEEYTYGYRHELSDGIWLVQTKPYSKSYSSLFWKVGNIERPCDVTTHAAIQAMEEGVTAYVQKLKDVKSEEFAEAKDMMGGFIKGELQLGNFSTADLVQLILRQVAITVEESGKL